MRIEFTKIIFKNILSFGNKLTEFNFNKGIDLVIAENGSGKSAAFSDAVCFALFGKAFRKIKNENLINYKNNKDLFVELHFDINSKSYFIQRGLKPKIFNIFVKTQTDQTDQTDQSNNSNKPKSNSKTEYSLMQELSSIKSQQEALEDIIGFNENVFRQLISLGANLSSSKTFMDLNKKEREEIFQMITDTSIFEKLKDQIKIKTNYNDTLIKDFIYQQDLLISNLTLIKKKNNQIIEANKKFFNDREIAKTKIKNKIKDNETLLAKYELGIQKLKDLKTEYNDQIILLNDYRSQLMELKDQENGILLDINECQNHINNKCENCGFIKSSLWLNQILDNQTNQTNQTNQDNKKSENELLQTFLENSIQKKDNLSLLIKDLLSEINKINDSLNLKKEKLLHSKRILEMRDNCLTEINNLNNELSEFDNFQYLQTNDDEIQKIENDLNDLLLKLKELKNDNLNLSKLNSLINHNNLRGKILSNQIPVLNKYINEFLEMFNTNEFQFFLDTGFNENIISRSDQKEFNSLSNGQKQRISLSILFAFLKLIEKRNGITTNLLVIDEFFDSSLDSDGTDEAINILFDVFAKSKDVIIISHNPTISNREDVFKRKFNIKRTDFSTLIEI